MNKHMRTLALAGLLVAACATTLGAARLVLSESTPDAARADRFSDPVEASVRREILSKTPELRQKSAPFLSLSIPDPLELPKTVGLREQPADIEAPMVATVPQRPVLGAPAK